MPNGKTKRFLPTGNEALVLLCFVVIVLAKFQPAMHAQQESASRQEDLGIIVTSTPEAAQEVLKELNAGMDFGVLAKEKSIDPSSNHGGYVGLLSPDQLRPELRDALNGVKAGQFTNVIQTSTGFGVLTVFPKTPNTEELNAKRIQGLLKAGAWQYNVDVSGLNEADTAIAEYRKMDGWNRDLRQMCAVRRKSYSVSVDRLEQYLSGAEFLSMGQNAPLDLLQGHVALAQLHAYAGDMEKAIGEWKIVYQMAQSGSPGSVLYVQKALGVSYLHLSEMENGAYRDAGTQDIFPPLVPGAHYQKQGDSKFAIFYLQRYLDQRPEDLEAKWLLNLAYMTLGQYPSRVPPPYLIPLSIFKSKESIGRFGDVSTQAGLKVFEEAGGVIVDDFDNDGLLDVITSSIDLCDPLRYFHNNGDGTFTDRSAQAGLSDQLGGLNILAADYNNDGCMDILVLRGGWEFPQRRSLLRNNCDGTFTDVTQESGLGGTITQTQTAAWADIDNDGYLDLFIGNEKTPSQLFRNRGDGTFEDISHAAGIDKTAFTKGVVAADYDNDGYPDFYVSNTAGAHFLYHNNHDGTFIDVAKQAGVQAPYYGFATWFFDYDNDGWPDLFVTSYFPTAIDEVMRSYLGLPISVETLKLYRNLHNGAFQDVTAQVGLDKVFLPMGGNFGDVDNDGYLDIYLGVGQPSFSAIMPHVLLRNKEGKSFVDITESSGTGELHKGHGIAFADLAGGGHEDIIAEIGGAVPGDRHTMRLFQNPGNDNDWINVRLTGVKTNRSAVGAQIKITVEDDGRAARSIYRTVGDTSSFGGNPMEQHIGLGHGALITALDVWWPTTNTRQHFTRVDKNQFIAIKEFANEFTRLDRRPHPLGGGKVVTAAK
jgi:tetratricopeptide (TPR) repeat protein